MVSALSAYKSALKTRNRGSRKKNKIPLAPVIGAVMTAWLTAKKIMQYVNDPGYAGRPAEAIADLAANSLGFANDGSGNYVFSWQNVWRGLLPAFIPLGGGVAAHQIAKRTGVNRALSAVPWFSV